MPQRMLHITLLVLYGILFHLGHSITSDQPSTTTAKDSPTTSAMHGKCSLTPFSTELRNSALFSHNHFRSLVARGLEENGKYVGVNAPVAARMNLMYYDCTAEYFAYDHVKTCDKKVSPREGYKENIHIFETATPLDETFVIQRAIYVWASELGKNGIPLVMRFTPEVRQYKKKVNSVTKMVWKYFAQKRGLAIGQRLAPVLAIAFMSKVGIH
ncbi:hypothetical protein KIN20_030874 [Parelaphostrongylus tenuis]|uniref:SCP domain-containing protein n=1 Tax=Parelaphostrongylus tenuis TaxID=148309 RepID=A0AAD5R4Q7_PARTN|nr:hypothetical protein KIN20_030874 [Parelaphostrongylus tenuis]